MELYTVDGVEIKQGLRVWDYDLKKGYIDLTRLGSDGWFDVIRDDGTRALMNDERVVTRHPVTKERA